jgi:predicted SnoaL-like aldol condensation-catalyzing enzyme
LRNANFFALTAQLALAACDEAPDSARGARDDGAVAASEEGGAIAPEAGSGAGTSQTPPAHGRDAAAVGAMPDTGATGGGGGDGGREAGLYDAAAASPEDAQTGVDGMVASACAPELGRTNRGVAAKAIEELFIDKDLSAIDRYWADPYSQHNPIAKSGVMTFRSLMSGLVSSAQFKYELYLALADCDLAVVYGRYSQTGTIFDMFRVKNGKLVEHWDSESSTGAAAASLDGLFVEAASVQEARALFSAFANPLRSGDFASAEGFLSASFVEHGGGTGPGAFTALLRKDMISYTKVHHIIVDGNFVFALSEGKRGAESHGFYDLFRVEAGKLAEHWSARRKVPASTASGLGIF